MDPVIILPTSRAIRARQLRERCENRFLSRYLTTGEFLQRALVAEGYSRADDDTRVLLLLEAADFSNFSALQIERNFFTFTQNSSFIFRFFEELSGELVTVDSLDAADTYGDYEEHIGILRELHGRYRDLCDARKILDPVFLPERTRLNASYVRSLGAIELVAEGYLTNFEFRILRECAAHIPVRLRLGANRFNLKLQQKLRDAGIDVRPDREQLIDLGNLKVVESSEAAAGGSIRCESFGERLLQVAFIKQQVYAFIEAGMVPEKIAVVLPDESFAAHLRRFDTEKNFNFAMGRALGDSALVRQIEGAMACLDNPSVQNRSRMRRMGGAWMDALRPLYQQPCGKTDLIGLITSWLEEESDREVQTAAAEELFYFEKILPYLADAPVKSALHLYVNRLKGRSVDDVRGGKVTVMGVLETRSVAYDGVIVVDFNEGVVPRRSEKDLFLNSAMRIKAGLPGARDREALQKLYYHNLFSRARKVAIAYVHSAESVPSRFLTQLGIAPHNRYDDERWADLLFDRHQYDAVEAEEIEADYDFAAYPLSATGLKSYLECKRKFYHRYVEGLKAHEIDQDLPREHEVGTTLHNALRDVYRETPRFIDKEALKARVEKALEFHNGTTPLDHYLHRLWMRRLEPFFEGEIERFADAEVIACETKLTTTYCGMTLTGQIDRIDRTPEGLEVLDYKSGKYPEYTSRTVESATDFQLEFYYLLAGTKGSVARCGYYDLRSGAIVEESLLETKLELLGAHLGTLAQTRRVRFEKTEKIATCRFCEFAHLCGREL